jgi:hypothetical protein
VVVLVLWQFGFIICQSKKKNNKMRDQDNMTDYGSVPKVKMRGGGHAYLDTRCERAHIGVWPTDEDNATS